jgi:hypothetical protein
MKKCNQPVKKKKLNKDVTYHYCDQPNCDYISNRKSHLKRHKAYVHDIDVTYHYCDQPNCDHKFKSNGDLKRHKAQMHDIGVTYHKCDQPDCDYKCKSNSSLKQHKAHTHDIGVTYHYCDQPNCDYKCKKKSHLKQHKAQMHDIGVTYHYCDQPDCEYKCKSNGSLKEHKANAHDIGVTYHYCDQPDCEYKCKSNSHLKQHKAYIHDIDVTYHYCDQPNCDHKFKSNGILKRHKKNVHDIGNNKCEVCYENRYSKILYKDNYGKHYICKKCYKTITGKESRIEFIWSDYIDKYYGIEYLSSSDRSLNSIGGCQLYRPDKIYISDNLVLLLECDEHQHLWQNGNYSCDEKRISDIYDEKGIRGKKLIVIRWNPDNYEPPKNYNKLNRKKRLKLMINVMKHVVENTPSEMIHIYYLFYNEDNERLSQNIPHTLIYDNDFIY